MYKYIANGTIKEVPSFGEALKREGLFFPEGVNPKSHFLVRIWYWDDKDEDYVIEELGKLGHNVFGKYVDALAYYRKLELDPNMNSKTGEMKIELVHKHLDQFKPILSRILFSKLLAGQY